MNISDFDYELPDERIARFPAEKRDASKLLVWRSECRRRILQEPHRNDLCDDAPRVSGSVGEISETVFGNIGEVLPPGSLLVFNNTRVVRARLVMHRPSGARVEILCLEPHDPADYERAFAAKGTCEWQCMIGNLKKWKSGYVECEGLRVWRKSQNAPESGTPGLTSGNDGTSDDRIVRFEWDGEETFGEVLQRLGRIPIPPYLGRDSQDIDNTRYQTVYSRVEGSVAAPTAGLHFTPELIAGLGNAQTCEVTLHVGAGTFLPVKTENALDHPMHTEHFETTLATLEHLIAKHGHIIAVGTTSVRTLESVAALGWRIRQSGGPQKGDPYTRRPVGQFEPYHIPEDFDGRTSLETLADWMRTHGIEKLSASTQIMITPAGLPPDASRRPHSADTSAPVDATFRFRVVSGIVTNFHQPKSTLLLLIAAFTGGGDEWRRIYDHALAHDFRFLSYGDSSLLLR